MIAPNNDQAIKVYLCWVLTYTVILSGLSELSVSRCLPSIVSIKLGSRHGVAIHETETRRNLAASVLFSNSYGHVHVMLQFHCSSKNYIYLASTSYVA
jgi:hypothetical protein